MSSPEKKAVRKPRAKRTAPTLSPEYLNEEAAAAAAFPAGELESCIKSYVFSLDFRDEYGTHAPSMHVWPSGNSFAVTDGTSMERIPSTETSFTLTGDDLERVGLLFRDALGDKWRTLYPLHLGLCIKDDTVRLAMDPKTLPSEDRDGWKIYDIDGDDTMPRDQIERLIADLQAVIGVAPADPLKKAEPAIVIDGDTLRFTTDPSSYEAAAAELKVYKLEPDGSLDKSKARFLSEDLARAAGLVTSRDVKFVRAVRTSGGYLRFDLHSHEDMSQGLHGIVVPAYMIGDRETSSLVIQTAETGEVFDYIGSEFGDYISSAAVLGKYNAAPDHVRAQIDALLDGSYTPASDELVITLAPGVAEKTRDRYALDLEDKLRDLIPLLERASELALWKSDLLAGSTPQWRDDPDTVDGVLDMADLGVHLRAAIGDIEPLVGQGDEGDL